MHDVLGFLLRLLLVVLFVIYRIKKKNPCEYRKTKNIKSIAIFRFYIIWVGVTVI